MLDRITLDQSPDRRANAGTTRADCTPNFKPRRPMTPESKALVQTSWNLVVPIADTAAELFYGRLFELEPSLRPMFRGDMKEQGKKLMQMITVVVRGLDRLDDLVPAIEALGRRHA